MIRHHLTNRALLALLLMALSGCPRDAEEEAEVRLLNFRTTELRVASATDTFTVRAEIAATEEERAVGLMERRSLPDDAGMIFLYPESQPPTASFWMYRTRIPLSIAFIDSLGTIRAIHEMVPCESTLARACPTYPAGVPFRAALEMNRGWFDRRGVRVGDRVVLPDPGVAAAR